MPLFTLIPPGLYLAVLLLLKGNFSRLTISFLFAGAVYLYKFHRNRTALFLFMILSGLLAGVGILLIPGSVYLAWYQLLTGGQPEGTVSSIFAQTAGILSYPGFLSILHAPRRKGFLYLMLSQSMILTLIYPGILSITLLILLTGYLFYLNIPYRERSLWLTGWIPLIFFLALVFSLLSPSPKEVRGSYTIDSLSKTLREKVLNIYPDYPLLFNLPGYGTGYKSSNGGGRPILTPATLFSIEGSPGESIYLKTESFSTFTGKVWISDPAVELEIAEPDEPTIEGRDRKLTVLTEYSRRIPYTEKTRYLKTAEMTYLVETSWDHSLELPEGFPLKQGIIITLKEQEHSYPAPVPEKDFVTLPERTRLEFRSLAETFYRDDPLETVRLIRNFLIREYTYTLETEAREFPLSYFLRESRRGYCIHFSSAFAVLARLNGIPVRLSGGYRVRIPPAEGPEERRGVTAGTAIITGHASHRWPEIYLKGRGWIIVEVTPPFTDENDGILDTEDEQTRSLLSDMGVPLTAKEESVHNRETYGVINSTLLGILIPLALIVLLLISGVYRYKNHLFKTVRLSIRHYRLFHIPSPEATGWVFWVDQVSGRSRCISSRRKELLRALLFYEYGSGKAGTEGEIIRTILKEDRSTWIKSKPESRKSLP